MGAFYFSILLVCTVWIFFMINRYCFCSKKQVQHRFLFLKTESKSKQQQEALPPLCSGWRSSFIFWGCGCQGWRTMTQRRWKRSLRNKFQTGKHLWVTPEVSCRAYCRFHKERKRIQKGMGWGRLGGRVPVWTKQLWCGSQWAGTGKRGPRFLPQPLGSHKRLSPKGRSISFASTTKERFTGNFPLPVQKYD